MAATVLHRNNNRSFPHFASHGRFPDYFCHLVVLMAWGMVFLTNARNGISGIGKKSWLFLILSGLATGASWLCYYKALQMGEVSKVVPVDKLSVIFTLIFSFIFLHEKFTPKSIAGCILTGTGTLLMVL